MIKLGILGAGRIGQIHINNAAANRHIELVAISDPFKPDLESFCAGYGCAAVTDFNDLLERDDIDGVVIATPTDTHLDLIEKAVEQGKAVLCEKPLDLDIDKARKMLGRLRDAKRIMLGFNRRFDPDFAALKHGLDTGQIGDLRQVLITSRDPGMQPAEYLKHSGGIFRDMVIHDFDMARFMLGEEPVAVSAFGSRLVDTDLEAAGDYDSVVVNLVTASGRQCQINCCREAVYGYDQRVELLGSTGMLFNENHRATSVRRWNRDTTDTAAPLLNFFLDRYVDAYALELAAFATAIDQDSPMPTNTADGLAALELADAAQHAADSGQIVHL